MESDLIVKVQKGEKNAVITALNHKGAIYRINGIINAARYSLIFPEIIDKILKLCNDNTFLDGYTVSDFAEAALELIGYKKYAGNNQSVHQLIESKFLF